MSAVDEARDSTPQSLYLSHHPVFKLASATTKLRVVFNASAPTSYGTSINELQYFTGLNCKRFFVDH